MLDIRGRSDNIHAHDILADLVAVVVDDADGVELRRDFIALIRRFFCIVDFGQQHFAGRAAADNLGALEIRIALAGFGNLNERRLLYNRNITLYTAGTETTNTENNITLFETPEDEQTAITNCGENICEILKTTIPNLICGAMPYFVRLHSKTHFTADIETLYKRILATLFEYSYADNGFTAADNAMMFFTLNDDTLTMIQYMSSDENEADIYYIPMVNVTNISGIRRAKSVYNNIETLPGICITSNSEMPDKSVMYSLFCVYAEFMNDAYLRPFISVEDDILLYCDCRKAYTMPYMYKGDGDNELYWYIDGLNTNTSARGEDAGNPNIIVLKNTIKINTDNVEILEKPEIVNPSIHNYQIVSNIIQNENNDLITISTPIVCGDKTYICPFKLPSFETDMADYYIDALKDSTIIYVSNIDKNSDLSEADLPIKGMNIVTIWTLCRSEKQTSGNETSYEYNYEFISEGDNENALYIISSSTSLAQLLEMDSKYMLISTAEEMIEDNINNKVWKSIKLDTNVSENEQEVSNQNIAYTLIKNDNLSLNVINQLPNSSQRYLDNMSIDVTEHPDMKTPYTTGEAYQLVLRNISYNELVNLPAINRNDYTSVVIYYLKNNGQEETPSVSFTGVVGNQEAMNKRFNVYINYPKKEYSYEYIPDITYPEINLSETLLRDVNVINRTNILSMSSNGTAYYAYFGSSVDDEEKSTLHIGTSIKDINVGTETLFEKSTAFKEHDNLSVDFETFTMNASYINIKEHTNISTPIMSENTTYMRENSDVRYIGQYNTPFIMNLDITKAEQENPVPDGNELFTYSAFETVEYLNMTTSSKEKLNSFQAKSLYLYSYNNANITTELESNENTAKIVTLYTYYNVSNNKFLPIYDRTHVDQDDPNVKYPIRINLKKFVKESLSNILIKNNIDVNTARIKILFNNQDDYPVAFDGVNNCLYVFMSNLALKQAILVNNINNVFDDLPQFLPENVDSIPINFGADTRMTVTYLEPTQSQSAGVVRVDVSLSNNLFANGWPTSCNMQLAKPTMNNQCDNIIILN